MTIIYKSFHKIKGITFKQIIQSKFYINLVNLFFKDNIQISTFILLIRIFIICARIDRNNSINFDYVKFTEKLKNFDINDEFYNLIIILITCRKGNVNYIGNKNSLPIIHFLFQTKYKMTLLEDFSNLLKNSVIQCFTASDVGIPMELSLIHI